MFAARQPSVGSLLVHDRCRIYATLIKDGVWHKFIIQLYEASWEMLSHHEKDTDPVLNCFLQNTHNAFTTLANGTDYCLDPELMKATFENSIGFIGEELSSKRVLEVLESPPDGDGIMLFIADAMITTVHNFAYYYEPSIPLMRETMMPAIRAIRKVSKDSSITTCCLLIIAFLMNESDDKKLVKITESEIIYLLDELKKSMLTTHTADYKPEELIDGLNRIAVRDINKLKLMECGILKLLSKSLNPIKNYKPQHQVAAAKAVWNLAFSEESRQDIRKQKGLMAG